mmetsp:Transcript_97701/g.173144  ORF Transcript_97701/g.173144 Transcript_97701/m.173144 type:complete len:80 (-) Transcript_97701:3414-3653(-)
MHSTNKHFNVMKTSTKTKHSELTFVDDMMDKHIKTINMEHIFLKMSTTECNGNRWGMNVMWHKNKTINAQTALVSCHAG